MPDTKTKETTTITIRVNGEPRAVSSDMTVGALVESLGLAGKACAVEVNKALVPKRDHARVTLDNGDIVELVTLVGGG